MPTLDEQKVIAAAIDAIVVKLNGHEPTAECLRTLFRTLVHQLMTAQLRVQALDLSALKEFAGNEVCSNNGPEPTHTGKLP
jgi:hypothetical protein